MRRKFIACELYPLLKTHQKPQPFLGGLQSMTSKSVSSLNPFPYGLDNLYSSDLYKWN